MEEINTALDNLVTTYKPTLQERFQEMTYTQLDSLLDSYDETKVEQVLLAMEFESDKTILPANYEPPKSYCEAMRRTQEKT